MTSSFGQALPTEKLPKDQFIIFRGIVNTNRDKRRYPYYNLLVQVIKQETKFAEVMKNEWSDIVTKSTLR